MTANELIALLQALTPDERKLQVVSIYEDRQYAIDAPTVTESTVPLYETPEQRWHRTYGSLEKPARPNVILL